MPPITTRQRAALWAWTEAGGLRSDLRQLLLQPEAKVGMSAERYGELIDLGRVGTPRTQQPGRCAMFDGVDDNINIGDVTAYNFARTQSISVSAWVYVSGTGTQCIVGKFSSSYVGWEVQLQSGRLRFWMASTVTTNNIMVVDNLTMAGGWHHVAVTYDGTSTSSGVRLYVDGVLSTNVVVYDNLTSNITYAASPLVIGRRVSVEDPFSGKMFDVRVYNRALAGSEIGNIYNTSKPGARPDDALYPGNLLGHWKLDDTQNTTKRDSSGNGNHGTPTGVAAGFMYQGADVPFSWQNEVGYSGTTDLIPQNSRIPTQDVLGSVLQVTGPAPRNAKLIDSFCGTFDGVDDRGATATNPTIAGAFTLAAWVYWGGAANKAIAGRYAGAGTGYLLYVGSGGVLQLYTANGTPTFASGQTIPSNTWVHVAGRWDGTSIRIYLNGVGQAGTNSGTPVNPGAPGVNFAIGGFEGGTSGLFNGRICDVELYAVALSDADVAALAANKDILTVPVGHWPLQEGSGTIAYDVSGGGRHATLTGITPASFWANRQPVNHRNFVKGYCLNGAVRIPSLNDGSNAADGNPITNAAGPWHNQAETRIDFTGGVPNSPWCDAARLGYSVPQAYNFGDTLPGSGKMTKNSVTVPGPREFNFQIT